MTDPPTEPSTPLLQANALRKTFGDHAALNGVDFEIRAGELLGLLGPNGAGKTTTLKLLLGMLRPSGGSAHAFGFDCTSDSLEVKRRIGYSPDEPAFYNFLTGKETIDFAVDMRGIPRESAWDELSPMVEILDFQAQLDVLTSNYSHGMKKKLALLLALAHRPKLLLLDEPTNGLDPRTAHAVREVLQMKARGGAGILISTHLLEMADRMCSRVMILDHGSVIAQGTPEQVREHAGVAASATLEDAFLRLIAR
jgi:ABC-2 type transport system ATP-binding protein